MNGFSFGRFLAVLHKEWIQVRRDPMTLRLIIALPVMQLFLFGYAINTDPKHLPTGLLSPEHSHYVRTIVAALRNTGYYDIRPLASEDEAERALAEGEVLFVINIPPNFERSVDRGETPAVLVDADATDPSAIGNATAALASLTATLNRDLPPKLQSEPAKPPFQFVVHARYNPEQLTVLNIVPGLVCIVLTFSTLIITTLSITRERERGTMENLLAMPVRPIEVMVAKIVPYIAVGYVQVVLIMAISSAVFDLPVRGSLFLLLLALGLFIASNLALGFTFSTIATSQMQVLCRWPNSPCCRRSCCPALCSRSTACQFGRSGRARFSRRRMRCVSCAASCSRAMLPQRFFPNCGRSSPLQSWWERSQSGPIGRRWIKCNVGPHQRVLELYRKEP
jgi:ABC-type Na+ efflux pump permease subunit